MSSGFSFCYDSENIFNELFVLFFIITYIYSLNIYQKKTKHSL
jgi:hypothetical protein